VNQVFPFKIKWLEGFDLLQVMEKFKELYNMLAIHGAIDVT
jgi:hypothetical protein